MGKPIRHLDERLKTRVPRLLGNLVSMTELLEMVSGRTALAHIET